MKRDLTEGLTACGIERSEARREAELIIEHASGLTIAQQVLKSGDPVDYEQVRVMRSILRRRGKRMPLQYCLGYTYFMGLKLTVRREVLIPRSDTETLVTYAIDRLALREAPLIVDIGTGSGAIAIALLKHLPAARAIAIDIAAPAVALARQNAIAHGVLDRMRLVHCDWVASLPDSADAIVANPPYIPRRQKSELAPEIALYEPELALFGQGADGLSFYRRFSKIAAGHLSESGFVALEVGDKQWQEVTKILTGTGWQSIETHNDIHGLPRVVSAAPGKKPIFKL